jgi:ParB-like chromosome segregation protein Spo0J
MSEATATQEKPATGLSVTPVKLDVVINHKEVSYRPLDKEWAEELSRSIETNGLDSPVLVWRGDNPKTKVKFGGETHDPAFLVAGLHRREALKLFRRRNPKAFEEKFPESMIPAFVKGGELTDMICASLRENVDRKDMPASEIIPVIERLQKEFKMKQKDIAAAVGKSASWVNEIMAIGSELGEEAMEEVKKGDMPLKDAKRAAKEVRSAKKAGVDVDAKEVVARHKTKAAERKAAGRDREPKRVSAGTLWKRYLALPTMKIVDKVEVLEGAFKYLVGAAARPPKELRLDKEKESKAEKE